MKISPLVRHAAALAAVLFCAGPIAVLAQSATPSAKGTPRPPPTPSATSAIPAGVDTGTPTTSNSVPLGLSTTPANDAEREGMKKESAAARAAARRRSPAASAPLAAGASAPDAAASSASGRASGSGVSPVRSPTPSRPAR